MRHGSGDGKQKELLLVVALAAVFGDVSLHVGNSLIESDRLLGQGAR